MNWKVIEAVGIIVGSIAGYETASTIIGAFIPATASVFKKSSMLIGATLIGSIVGGKCMEEAGEQIRAIHRFYERVDFDKLFSKKVKEH